MAEEEKSGTSPWVFIGIGCLLAVFLLIAMVGGVAFWGYRQVRNLQETMENPAARTEKSIELLGADEIPAGYNAVVAISIPFLVETVVLSDREPDEDGHIEGFDERGFIYVKTLRVSNQEEELRDFFEGRREDSDFLDQSSVRVNTRELIGRGTIEESDRTLRWVAYRGEIGDRRSRELDKGLTSMVMFECGTDQRVRLGIWFGPDPAPETPVAEADFSGTVADEAEIRSFMDHFAVCGR